MSKSLDSEYLQFVDEASQRLFEKFKSDEKSVKFAESFLAGEGGYVTRGKIDKARFEEAMSSDSYEGLREIFLQVPKENLFSLCSLNEVKVVASKSSRISGENHEEAVDHLKQIAGVEDRYDGVCVVKAKGDVREIGSENSDKPFSLHSIGKVLTGALVAEMVSRGIIPESDLSTTGLQLDEDVRKTLQDKLPQVSKRIDEVTLHQTMTHRAGFHDYLPKYMDAIEFGVDAGEIPYPTNPRDFLVYANDKVKDHEGGTKKSYSNMGILLVGLVAEHYYNKERPESGRKSYNEILQELVLEPARITGFSITPPAHALINSASKVQPNMCGSPAGGYWATAYDMQNFAQHLCDRMQDERFRSTIENYGQEFYDKEKQVISHAGDIGAEGSSWFSVHVPSGISCVMAQNNCFARMTGEQVSILITREREREALKTNFSKIDNPSENLDLSAEARVKMADAFAQAHIDKYSDLPDEAKKQKFISRLTTALLGKEDDSDAMAEMSEAIKDKGKLSNLFLKLEDEKLVQFNWDKDGFAAFKPTDLNEESIQQYCDDIDFRGVMVVEDGAGNQTRVSNYHKGTQEDPGDRPFATHSVSKLIGGVTMCKMIADGIIPQDALDAKLELSDEVKRKLPEEILQHLETQNVTLRDVMTHHSGLGGYLDSELKEGQVGYGTRELGYGVNGYSGYVRQQLEKGEEVEVPNSPQDYLKYSEKETYEHGKFKYSDLGIVLASLSAEHHYNKDKDPSEHKSFEEIVREQLIIPAGVERFSAQKPADAICHLDDPIAPYITGTTGCGYFTNLDGLVKIGRQIGKMWQEDEAFRGAVQNCGDEFYDKEKQIIKHPGGIDSSKTLLSVDLNNGSVVVTEERRLGNDFPFPGWGVATAAANLGKEQSDQKQSEEEKPQSFVEKLGLQKRSTEQEKSFVERMISDATKGKSQGGFNEL